MKYIKGLEKLFKNLDKCIPSSSAKFQISFIVPVDYTIPDFGKVKVSSCVYNFRLNKIEKLEINPIEIFDKTEHKIIIQFKRNKNGDLSPGFLPLKPN